MLASPTFRSSFKEKERDVLNLFTVEGEGGYLPLEYSFMFKGSAFFTSEIANSVANVVKDDSRIKSFVIPGTSTTVKYMDNVLRVVLGNHNQCILYRDGKVDIGNNTYDFPYMRTIMYEIKDTFCPSSYSEGGAQYQQMLLLNNGDLVFINPYNKTNVTALTGVQKFLSKNQAHRSDAIVGCENGDVYHVWVGPTPRPDNDGNGTPSGVIKINGIRHTDLLFCTMGDAPANCTFCLKSDPQKIYRFTKTGTNFKITGLPISFHKIEKITQLKSDECKKWTDFLVKREFIFYSKHESSTHYCPSYLSLQNEKNPKEFLENLLFLNEYNTIKITEKDSFSINKILRKVKNLFLDIIMS